MFRTIFAFFVLICTVGCDLPTEPAFNEATTAEESTDQSGQQGNSFSTVTGDLIVTYERLDEFGGTRETFKARCEAEKVEFYPEYVLIYGQKRIRLLKTLDLKVFDVEKR